MYSNEDLNNMNSDIKSDLELIECWLKHNKLRMNISKSNYIIFDRHKQIDDNIIPDIIINNTQLKKVSETKYLGLHIDSKLNWHTHINTIKNKVRPVIFALYRLRFCLNKNALWNIYHAYILSNLTYLIEIWSSASSYKLKELEVIQNKSLRIIYGFSYLHTRSDLYNESILPLNKIINYKLLILIYCLKNNLLKHNFQIFYIHDIHDHYTRRQSHIHIPIHRTNIGLYNILSRCIQLFNLLPSNIKYCPKISIYKKEILKYLNS